MHVEERRAALARGEARGGVEPSVDEQTCVGVPRADGSGSERAGRSGVVYALPSAVACVSARGEQNAPHAHGV